MPFIKLKTPNTDNYKAVKEFVLGTEISWQWYSDQVYDADSVDNSKWNTEGFYSHCLLSRPKSDKTDDSPPFPLPQSDHLPLVTAMIQDILEVNPSLKFNYIHRMNINCTHYTESENHKISVPHRDHEFPHKNMLIYFTDSGGGTHLTDAYGNVLETHEPQEDDIVVFEGWHAMHMPKRGRRIVCVVTFS